MHPLLLPLTVPLSWGYRAVIARRNRRFDRGANVTQFDTPVISVGNLTVGGTGKSPLVAWVAQTLLDEGHQPVIAMRGYGASPDGQSDEADEYQGLLGGRVPVLAQPDRAFALRHFLPRHPEIDCILLDDGFQHRRIARTLDLVLLDASRPTFSEHLLPAGRLREPVSTLKRADGVILTHADWATPTLVEGVESLLGRPLTAQSRHVWTELTVHLSTGERSEPVTWLDGKRVSMMAGVGNTRAVISQLRQAGAIVKNTVPVRDHQRYTARRLSKAAEACSGVDLLVTTPKDWVKISPLVAEYPWPVPIVIPRLALRFDSGEDRLRELIQSVFTDHSPTLDR